LTDITRDAGPDGGEIRTAVADETFRDRVQRQFAGAREEGVTGVPTFVYDGTGARGAVPPDHLQRLVEGA
jgi:predicted DsbA family dithiol-disulfide isomerase